MMLQLLMLAKHRERGAGRAPEILDQVQIRRVEPGHGLVAWPIDIIYSSWDDVLRGIPFEDQPQNDHMGTNHAVQ
jgi:hypothetical protein